MQQKLLEYLRTELTKEHKDRRECGSGLLGGDFGETLALFMLNRQFGLPQYDAERLLDKTLNEIHHHRMMATYCNGLAGTGIGLMLLADKGFIELDSDALGDFDAYLSRAMAAFIEQGNFDLLHGSTGIALYFTKRSDMARESAREALAAYVNSLEKALVKTTGDDGAEYAWCRMKKDFSQEERNISMSHGLSGIANVLAQIYARHILPATVDKKAKEIIEALTRTILAQRIDFTKYRSAFPSYYKSADEQGRFSRLAWCYGDLGILATLSMVAVTTGNASLAARIEPLVLAQTTRRCPEHTYVRDACVCHGAAGIYAFFRHFSRRQPDNGPLRLAADYWKDYILALPLDRLCYDPISKTYSKQYSILNGYAGIALAHLDDYSILDKLLLYERI
ncbi:lanthionine synthetase LanC family protein [uncultured Muribaculum sp.]|uniref:lanthionine synthetase LanC family protein n=1 Tax=uncultured Muribaculum sp. TaxID=1918613 RepID=UPI0025FF9860|nr:lanthionine synthetase LanC family protein [uncultured Muribaculum sp.]